ncbi:MAG TPA: hypothetical protein VIJ07_09885, partial [Dermatophilaceae bacterium]
MAPWDREIFCDVQKPSSPLLVPWVVLAAAGTPSSRAQAVGEAVRLSWREVRRSLGCGLTQFATSDSGSQHRSR